MSVVPMIPFNCVLLHVTTSVRLLLLPLVGSRVNLCSTFSPVFTGLGSQMYTFRSYRISHIAIVLNWCLPFHFDNIWFGKASTLYNPLNVGQRCVQRVIEGTHNIKRFSYAHKTFHWHHQSTERFYLCHK